MSINKIALDNLRCALETGESIDTDEHRDTVVDLYTAYATPPDEPETVDEDEPETRHFKSYGPLPVVP